MHILDREGVSILDTLDIRGENIYWDDKYTRTIFNTEKYEFKVLPESRAAEYLGNRNRVVAQTGDGFFREFIVIQTVQQINALEVYCVGAQLELAEDEPFPPLNREGETINSILDYALSRSRWKRGVTDYTTAVTYNTDAYKSPLQIINRAGALFDVEVSFRVDIDPGGNEIKGRYVDAKIKNPVNRGKKFAYGKDLINVTNTDDNAEIYTALVGVAPPREDGEGISVVVKNEAARQVWGIEGKHRWGIYEPQSEQQDMTENQLRSYTERELEKRISSVVEYEVDAVDLEHIFGYEHEQIRLGDEVRIVADDYNPALYLKARVIEVEYSLADPSQKKFTLGEFVEVPESSIVQELQAIKRRVASKVNKRMTDSDGEETGNLDGENNSISKTYIADLTSPTVPMKSQTDIILYVSDRVINDGDEPSDDNDGQSFSSPLATPTEAIRRIPENLNHEARIVFAYNGDFFDYIRLDGFYGSGKIVLNGQYKWGTTLYSGIRATGSQVNIEVREMHIICESDYEVFATNAGNVQFIDCAIKGQAKTPTTTHGLIAYNNGKIKAINCHFYNLRNAMYAYDGGHIVNEDNKGQVQSYGLRARTGGVITGTGTAPTGSLGGYIEYDGGSIPSPDDFTFEESVDETESVVTTTTKRWNATSSDSYTGRYNVWDNTTNQVLQGRYGSAGPYWGAWFFGSGPSDTVTGKTIKQMRIKVERAKRSGDGGAVPIFFRSHSYTSRPSGQPGFSGTSHQYKIRQGDDPWVTLPKSFHAEWESGSRKGIGIYSGSSYYARMLESATLEITYEG